MIDLLFFYLNAVVSKENKKMHTNKDNPIARNAYHKKWSSQLAPFSSRVTFPKLLFSTLEFQVFQVLENGLKETPKDSNIRKPQKEFIRVIIIKKNFDVAELQNITKMSTRNRVVISI